MNTYRPRQNQENNPEINITMRSYKEVNQKAELVSYGGDTDPVMPPNFGTLFPNRLPSMVKTYSVYSWDYANNKRGTNIETNWPVNLIGLYTIAGESIVAPKAGRTIGNGNVLMVLYATDNTLVFTHSTSDLYTDENGNWSSDGYLIYVDDICVDRNLLTLYQQQNSAGRGSLPVLATGQVFGYGKGIDIKVGIRDSMDWMDPRAQKDWWQGYTSLPPPPTNLSPNPTQPINTPVPTSVISTPTPPSAPTPTPNLLPSPTSVIPTNKPPLNTITPTQINPTMNTQPTINTIPSSTITPTVTLTPTPTKTLRQKITDSPVIKFIGIIKERVSQLILVMLP
jgi:hypothetical protein